MNKRILIFTDSRGQHKPHGSTHSIFGEKIASKYSGSVDLYLCPYKWTTIVDLFITFSLEELRSYDCIILYTGIVDWSPRPYKSAVSDIYNNQKHTADLPLANIDLKYQEKIVNRKKDKFDEIFSEEKMLRHFSGVFDCLYEGQSTINMYSVKMFEAHIIPILNSLDNLIFINSNNIVSGWEGDFKRGRPANINLVHDYSKSISHYIKKNNLLDISKWSDDEIKIYTCDNMHLTQSGSDFIYNELVKMIEKKLRTSNSGNSLVNKQREYASKIINSLWIPVKVSHAGEYPEKVINQLDTKCVNAEIIFKYQSFITSNAFDYLVESSGYKVPTESELIDLELKIQSTNALKDFVRRSNKIYDYWYKNVFFLLKHFVNSFPLNYLSEFRSRPDFQNNNNSKKSISFIYCAKNRSRRLEISLKSLAMTLKNNCNSFDFEIIIVEDIGDDVIAKNTLLNLGLDITIYKVDSTVSWTRAGLLNFGLNKSISEIVAFVDVDTIFPFIFSDHLFKYINEVDFSSYILPINMIETHPHYKDGVKHLGGLPYSYMWVVSRQMAINVGGYDEKYIGWGSEDRDFQLRLERVNNLKTINSITLDKNFYVFHFSHNTRTGSENKKTNHKMLKEIRSDYSNSNNRLNIKLIEKIKIFTSNSFNIVKDGIPSNKTIVVLGNGPSLKHIDLNILKSIDTFALNSSYRFFKDLNFYPTYFGCFDNLVTTNHRLSFQELLNDNQIPIKKFFFIQKFNDPYDRLNYVRYDSNEFTEQKMRTRISESLDDFWIYENSGASAVHACLAMGYKKIILLGVDCNYVQVVEGAVSYKGKSNELIIKQTPSKNPNYWRDDYQVAGDVYHTPDAHKFQKPEWERLSNNILNDKRCIDNNVKVYNCSPTSTLNCFEYSPLHRLIDIPTNYLLSQTSFIIKSFGRFAHVLNLIESIRKFSINSPIIVLDDSNIDHSKFVQKTISYNIEFHKADYDIGLSYGRNLLVEMCKTKYLVLLDDDFIFDGNLESFYNSLKLLSSSSLDIIGGSVYDIGPNANTKDQPRTFHGNIIFDDNRNLKIVNNDICERFSPDGYLLSDLVMNFFVAKVDSVKKVMWDNRFKLGEHLDFFIRCKSADLNIFYYNDMQIKHVRDFETNSNEYIENRSRAKSYHDDFKKKHNINSIYQHGKVIDG